MLEVHEVEVSREAGDEEVLLVAEQLKSRDELDEVVILVDAVLRDAESLDALGCCPTSQVVKPVSVPRLFSWVSVSPGPAGRFQPLSRM